MIMNPRENFTAFKNLCSEASVVIETYPLESL